MQAVNLIMGKQLQRRLKQFTKSSTAHTSRPRLIHLLCVSYTYILHTYMQIQTIVCTAGRRPGVNGQGLITFIGATLKT